MCNWAIYVTGIEIGIHNSHSSLCMDGKGKEVGDIGRCTALLHMCESFSCLNKEADDCDIIR